MTGSGKRLGILVSGGPAPGINSAISATTIEARNSGLSVLGIFDGLLVLKELQQPDRCCGSAGIYNLTQAEMSRQVLGEKMADVRTTGCDVIATANPGCMLQLELGVRLDETDQEVVHVIEMLDRAYEASS